uniref:Regulator of microtubule dynamics protein 2 n=1 Tax=Erpetoichthys calabaricus TaxID=27687 RepID=A0A8C4SS17_ERPCA
MSESNSKVTVLTVMAGAAGITLAFMWFKRNGIFSQKVYSPQLCISNNKDQHSLAHVDGGSGGPALLLQGRPVDVLEKLNALIACVSELKEEVRSLKEAIPKLNERVCTEVFQKGVRKASPQHRGSRRKKAETFRDDYMSSEDAESENGFAIMCGYMSEYESVQNKIKNGYLFKDHLDKAIELKPQDPQLYYLLGRWCYAVSQLSWLERKVAATLFGNPPSATIHDALQYFHKVFNCSTHSIHPLSNPLYPNYRVTRFCVYHSLCKE